MCKYKLIQTHTCKSRFDCTVDHWVLTYIMNSKAEPASTRIKKKKLLEVLNTNPVNLYFMKRKDMAISDFFLD